MLKMIQLVKTNRTDRSNKRRRVWLDGVSSCIIQKSARRTKQTLPPSEQISLLPV